MGLNDKVRADLDLHNGSNLGMGVYTVERSYPKVGVGQTLKRYLEYFSSYEHFSKLNPELEHGFKVSTNLDLHNGSNLGMGCILLKGLILRSVWVKD